MNVSHGFRFWVASDFTKLARECHVYIHECQLSSPFEQLAILLLCFMKAHCMHTNILLYIDWHVFYIFCYRTKNIYMPLKAIKCKCSKRWKSLQVAEGEKLAQREGQIPNLKKSSFIQLNTFNIGQ